MNSFNHYGGSGSNLISSSTDRDIWSSSPKKHTQSTDNINSFIGMNRNSVDDVMQEFRNNGLDSPYDPDEERDWTRFSGLGPSSSYLRQKSWPAPESTPRYSLTPAPPKVGRSVDFGGSSSFSSDEETITEEQMSVLRTLPEAIINIIVNEFQRRQIGARKNRMICRFCRNNGERESWYSSHVLRDARGAVRCPVLRALVCPRCGAAGDNAHTATYCPMATYTERAQSAAMMRSVRLATHRRRPNYSAYSAASYNFTNDVTAPSVNQTQNYDVNQPLDPVWADLERKLNL